MKKRILIVTDYYYPHWTGISKSLDYLTQSLKSSFDFAVLTVRFKKNLPKIDTRNGVKILREDYFFSLSRSKYSPATILRFLMEVKKHDIVFINSPCSNTLPVAILAKIFGKKLFVFHQGDLILPKGPINRVLEKIFDISTYIAFFLADKVSSYTKDYAEHSRALKPFLHKLTPFLIPIPPPKKLHRGGVTQGLKGEEKILFGFAGRFVEEKGFDILFDAIPRVIKRLPSVHFVFAGETNIAYENFYQKNQDKIKKLKKHLTFLGLLIGQKLAEFYSMIDFIVVPSRSDCFNLVQAEAMLSETPSIASDIPGLRFLVEKTGFGVTFKKENPQDLADKIIMCYKNKIAFLKHYQKVKEVLDYQKNVKEAKNYFEN